MGSKEVVMILSGDRPDALPDAPLDTRSAEEVQAVLAEFGASSRPLFPVAPETAVPGNMALSDDVAAVLTDQARYRRVIIDDEHAEALVAKLRELPDIEAAYVKPATENPLAPKDMILESPVPDVAPVIPNFVARQGYLDPAPNGVDARFAWSIEGGRGQGIRIVDIEGAWQFTHIDLTQNDGGLLGGTAYNDVGWRDHGTAVLGEIGGDDNTFGVVGIAPDALLSGISHKDIGSAAAIQMAAQKLSAGDIILLEMHRPGPRFGFEFRNDQRGYIAVEWWPDDALAVQYALAKGIIVIEAAGNGAEDLDSELYDIPGQGFPARWTNPFRQAPNALAAIMVGAGAPAGGAHGAPRSRLGFSNFGQRIDCQGWGRGVVTTGYGRLFRNSADPTDENYWYTADFSGTSSASPIVTGAAACLSGIAKARGRVLTCDQLRDALQSTGSPQPSPASEKIGNLPDLTQLVAALFP